MQTKILHLLAISILWGSMVVLSSAPARAQTDTLELKLKPCDTTKLNSRPGILLDTFLLDSLLLKPHDMPERRFDRLPLPPPEILDTPMTVSPIHSRLKLTQPKCEPGCRSSEMDFPAMAIVSSVPLSRLTGLHAMK